MKFTKTTATKALRTFIQTAIGYVLTNLALVFGGIDYTDTDVLLNAGIGLVISAVSAGASAVMNLERSGDTTSSK